MNAFLELIELKRQEAEIKKALPPAKQKAIEYYRFNPVLVGEKKTGQFSSVDGKKLPATLTWKLVSTKVENPDYAEKFARLVQVEESLGVLYAERLTEIKKEVAALNCRASALLVNDETEELKKTLAGLLPTLEGQPVEELSVTLPK